MIPTIWQVATLLLSMVGLVISIATFARAGRWRATDDGRKVLHKLNNLEMKMVALEERSATYADKSAVARIEGRLDGLERMVGRVGEAVDRIEGYFISKGTA